MNDRIELNKYAAAVWRGKWLILAAIVLAGLGAAVYKYKQPPSYTAEALIRTGRVWKEPLEDAYSTAETINSQGFLDSAAHKLSMKPGQLRRAIRASVVTAGPQRSSYPILVRVSASTTDADQSMHLAEAVANEVVTAHQVIFDQAMAPHLETQHRLEELAGNDKPATFGSLDAQVRLEQALGDVKASNTSPTITEKTRLLEPVARQSVAKPDIWQPAAVAAFSAGLVATAAAILLAFLSASSHPAALATADKELSNVTPG